MKKALLFLIMLGLFLTICYAQKPNTFKIKSTRVDNETLWVDTKFTLTDNTTLRMEVPIFVPQKKNEVLKSLGRRLKSEQAKYDAMNVNNNLKSDIDANDTDKNYQMDDNENVTLAE